MTTQQLSQEPIKHKGLTFTKIDSEVPEIATKEFIRLKLVRPIKFGKLNFKDYQLFIHEGIYRLYVNGKMYNIS